MTDRFSKAGLGTASFALMIGLALVLFPLAPAEAAPRARHHHHHAAALKTATHKKAKPKLAQAEPATTGSLSKGASADQPACDRARRRLWVEGEGWVVRRVSTCY